MDDARTFGVADIFPFNDPVLVSGFRLCFEAVKGAAISPSEQVCTFRALDDFVFAIENVETVGAQP